MDIVPQLIANSIIAGSLYALVAMSFNLIFATTRFFNLAHGVVAAIGGYVVLYLGEQLGMSVWIAVPLAVLSGAVSGLLLELLLYRTLRARKASPLVLLIASLGAFTALQAVIAILFTSQFQTLGEVFGSTGLVRIAGAIITHTQVALFACALGVFAILWVMLKKTRFGKAVRAVSDDEEVAKIVGINTNRIIALVFIIGSAIVALAGILSGIDTGIEPTMGLGLLLKGVIAAIVGGIGSVPGGFLGAFLLGFVENFGIWHLSGQWKDAIAFAVLILFLLFRPQGILGKK